MLNFLNGKKTYLLASVGFLGVMLDQVQNMIATGSGIDAQAIFTALQFAAMATLRKAICVSGR